jgi:uncharacterized protein YjbJ (UPF0337 family)
MTLRETRYRTFSHGCRYANLKHRLLLTLVVISSSSGGHFRLPVLDKAALLQPSAAEHSAFCDRVCGTQVAADRCVNPSTERKMDNDKLKGKWHQLKGEIKRKWGKMTDDDLTEAEGNMEKLIGKIQERSGERREAIQEWFDSQNV